MNSIDNASKRVGKQMSEALSLINLMLYGKRKRKKRKK